MARALRVQYPGAICHVLSRGDRREEIVRDDEDRAGTLPPRPRKAQRGRGGEEANHLHEVAEVVSPQATAGRGGERCRAPSRGLGTIQSSESDTAMTHF